MPFRAVYYHLVWATKYRQPLITTQIESRLIEIIQHKSQELNSEIFAINTVSDHIHVAVSISPSVAVSKWVQQVKGISTHDVNLEFPNNEHRFQWQPSYGVVTFGAKNLPMVVDYIRKQKEHHANHSLLSYLEKIEDDE